MRINKYSIIVSTICLLLSTSCSSDSDELLEETPPVVAEDTPGIINTSEDSGNNDPVIGEGDSNNETEGITTEQLSALSERFVFDENIVIENSYTQDVCERIPCGTMDEDLFDIFDSEERLPDDPYFEFSEDLSVLNLRCKFNEGRRIEFKQDSEGPLTTPSILTMEGRFFDIPSEGVTIAQVHNRGSLTGGDKPFFRVVLHEDRIETVLRGLPVVSSSNSNFFREEYQFLGGENYTSDSVLRIVIGKGQGHVFLSVEQDGEFLTVEQQGEFALDPVTPDRTYPVRTYVPVSVAEGTRDSAIGNGSFVGWDSESIVDGFYLKGGLYNDEIDHTEDLEASFTTVIFDSEDTND